MCKLNNTSSPTPPLPPRHPKKPHVVVVLNIFCQEYRGQAEKDIGEVGLGPAGPLELTCKLDNWAHASWHKDIFDSLQSPACVCQSIEVGRQESVRGSRIIRGGRALWAWPRLTG